jgi:hypothetical protein
MAVSCTQISAHEDFVINTRFNNLAGMIR